jgi:CubicO group peptidase (beta-lactamase class C family)
MMRVYSMTKSYTAVGVMVLADEGKLRLDDPVAKYIPAWSSVRVAHGKDVVKTGPKNAIPRPQLTIRHLITHTCGLGYLTMPKETPPSSAIEHAYCALIKRVDSGEISSLGAFVDALAGIPLRFQPGTQWEYGFGFDVAARVIEVVSGMPIADFLERRVLQPLNMRDTGFHVLRSKAAQIGKLYRQREKKLVVQDPAPGSKGISDWVASRPPPVCSGGGVLGDNARHSRGMVSSPEDAMRFCLMLRNGGVSRETGKRLLKASTVQLLLKNWLPMQTVTGTPHSKKRFSWGKGLGFSPLGQIGVPHARKKNWFVQQTTAKCENLDKEIGHGGWPTTYWSVDPVEDLCLVFFTQHPEMKEWKGDADLWKAGRTALLPRSRRLKLVSQDTRGKKRMLPSNPELCRKVARC